MSANQHSVPRMKQKDLLRSNPLKLAAIMYWAISSVINRPKTALICGNKQSMASKFAEQSGFDTINVLPKSLLQRYGFWIYDRAISLGYEPSILAEASRDSMLLSKVMAGFSDLGQAPRLIKQRTIDEQYSGLHKLDWLHIEDTSPDLLLAGCVGLLGRDKPIITLNNVLNAASSEAVMALLKKCGYQCFSHTLELIDLDAKAGDCFPSAWVCIHQADKALQTIRTITSFDTDLAINNGLGSRVDIIKGYYNSLIDYKTQAKNMLEEYLFSDNQIIEIDTQLVDGFYAQEHSHDDKWNWSGPSSESKILLPIEAAGQYHFSTSVYSLPHQVASLPLYVFVDGEIRASIEIERNCEIAFDFTITQGTEVSAVEVLFCIPSIVQINGRRLGFSLNKIELYFKENELQ
jgi:hypothetical protein